MKAPGLNYRAAHEVFERAVLSMTALGIPRDKAERRAREVLGYDIEPRVEDDIVADGDELMAACGFRVVRCSQKRRSKVHEGLPDRRYYHLRRRLKVWWEAKAIWGKQTPAQRDYQEMCDATDDPYVLGGLQPLRDWLVAAGVVASFDAAGIPTLTPLEQPT